MLVIILFSGGLGSLETFFDETDKLTDIWNKLSKLEYLDNGDEALIVDLKL